jgi:hypothetical protein
MSIEILFRLVCKGCRKPFGDRPETATNLLTRGKLEALRDQAVKKGWGRFRESPTASLDDYCPKCVAGLRRAMQIKEGAAS